MGDKQLGGGLAGTQESGEENLWTQTMKGVPEFGSECDAGDKKLDNENSVGGDSGGEGVNDERRVGEGEFTEEDRQNKLDNLVQVLDADERAKELMVEMAPDWSRGRDLEAVAGVSDKMAKDLKSVVREMREMIRLSPDPDVAGLDENFKQRVRELSEEFNRAGVSVDGLEQFYTDKVTTMRPEFIRAVENTFVPFSPTDPKNIPIGELLDKTGSLNEMLYLMHSKIMRSDFTYGAMPVLKKNAQNHNYLFGDKDADNLVAERVFEAIDADNSEPGTGWQTVVAPKEGKVMALLRDYGHALSIDAERNGDGTWAVHYHIPDVKNLEKTNGLRGVKRVNSREEATSGSFLIEATDEEEVARQLIEFIESVPTDEDVVPEITFFIECSEEELKERMGGVLSEDEIKYILEDRWGFITTSDPDIYNKFLKYLEDHPDDSKIHAL